MKLSILILTIPSRAAMFGRLQTELWSQMLPYAGQVELLTDGGSESIGTKRNRLLEKATGEYVAFIDDDDGISSKYISLLMSAISNDVDCVSLTGIITTDGKDQDVFEHSIKYNEWKTNPKGHGIRYERFPNHLNCVRASIAKQFKYPEKNHGEDFDWSTLLHQSGLLKTECYVPEVLYYYRYVSNK